jgi:hypothetical protein
VVVDEVVLVMVANAAAAADDGNGYDAVESVVVRYFLLQSLPQASWMLQDLLT